MVHISTHWRRSRAQSHLRTVAAGWYPGPGVLQYRKVEPLRRIHALGQHCDVQRFAYHILQHSCSMMFAKCQLPLQEKQTFSSISAGGDRHPLTYPHVARTLHASTVAHSAARSFSIPQTLTSSNLQARGSGSSNDRVATKLLRYENSVVESSPEAHASARCVGAPADPQRMLERHKRDNAAPIAAFRT
jgi:hypothetical protein